MIRKKPHCLSHGGDVDVAVGGTRVGLSAIFGTQPGEQDVLIPWWGAALVFFAITAGIIVYVAKSTEHLR